MRIKIFIQFIFLVITFLSCKNEAKDSSKKEQVDYIKIKPLEQLKQTDKLLSQLSEKPQKFTTSSNKATIVTGKKGTVIHLDPTYLETADGSPLGDDIQIELLELTNKSNLILNNAQTTSNGQILVTGGAYYINILSNGKQLKIKQGEGIKVEFPKLTENEMELFLGERDSLGQTNWIRAKQNFNSKKIAEINKPKEPALNNAISAVEILEFDPEIDSVIPPKKIERNQVSSEVYQEYLKELKKYEKRKKEIAYQRKTYEAVRLINFGWINCDRFYEDPSPKTDIRLTVNNDSVKGARIFAVFKEINSIMTEHYWKGHEASFRGIPKGKELKIIALTAKDETPYIFERTINTDSIKQVKIEFSETSQEEIKEKLKRMN